MSAKDIRAIEEKYGRRTNYGRRLVMRCMPSKSEQRSGLRRESGSMDTKVIYDDEATAQAAEAEMRACDARVRTIQMCGRSEHGHFHVILGEPRPIDKTWCPDCRKTRYRTRVQAAAAARGFGPTKAPYPCPSGGGFHFGEDYDAQPDES